MILDRIGYVSAAADTGGTVAGIAFWVTLPAVHVLVVVLVLRGVLRAPLSRRSRNRWVYLVALAPGLGVVLWLVRGRPEGGEGPRRVW